MKNFKILFFTILIELPFFGYSQWSLDVHANGGIGNFISKDLVHTDMEVPFEKYYGTAISIGSEIGYQKDSTKWKFATGLDLTRIPIVNNLESNKKEWRTAFYSLQIPITINRVFEKWVYFSAGLVNTIHIVKPETKSCYTGNEYDPTEIIEDSDIDYLCNLECNSYILGIKVGIDFFIKEKYTLGFIYYRDMMPSFTYTTLYYGGQYEGYTQQLTLKLGYKIF